MNIKPAIYENLTAHERVIASIEALARGDEEEKKRLVKTCPKKTYTMSDGAYSDKMKALFDIAMAVECDMRGYALKFLLVQWLDNNLKGDKEEIISKIINKTPLPISEAISIRQAWHEVLRDEGIDPVMMEKSFNTVKHFAVELIENIADHMGLEPNPDNVKMYKDVLKEYLGKAL